MIKGIKKPEYLLGPQAKSYYKFLKKEKGMDSLTAYSLAKYHEATKLNADVFSANALSEQTKALEDTRIVKKIGNYATTLADSIVRSIKSFIKK